MADLSSVATAFAALQTAGQIAKSMVGVRDAALVQGKVIELQSVILSAQESALTAQSEQSSLIDKVRGLEQQVTSLKDWAAEKEPYQLTELPPGVYVRALKPDMAGGDPAHQLCEQCYQDGVKAILHRSETVNGRYHLKCTRCGADHTIGRFVPPPSRSSGGSWMGS